MVNCPLQYFTERIGGDLTTVAFPAPHHIDPAFWSPDADTLGGYQDADLILLNGAGYAKWLSKAYSALRARDPHHGGDADSRSQDSQEFELEPRSGGVVHVQSL